jgi:predicted dehydrogenase
MFANGNKPLTPQNQRIIRYGIIGTGRIANDFAADLRYAGGAALHSALSRDMASAKRFAQTHGSVQAHDSIDEFLKDPALDAVYVATPNSAHLPQALACIRAGKPVIVEKPLAMSASAAQIIADEAAKAGVPVMEGMWIRFLPGIIRARDMIRAGEIGDVTGVSGELSYKHDYDPDSRLFSKALGGGAALDLGVYLLSLSVCLFGVPENLTGTWQSASGGVDVSAAFQLSYPGFGADLRTSLTHTGGNAFEIAGTKGVLRIEDPFIRGQRLRLLSGLASRSRLIRPPFDQPMSLAQKLANRLPLPGQRNFRFPYCGHGLHFEATAFADLVRGGANSSAIAPLADSVVVLRMIESVLSRPPG